MGLFKRKSPESQVQTTPETQPARSGASGVTFHDNVRIELNIQSVAEAKVALRQLKLKKKEVVLLKRQVNERE